MMKVKKTIRLLLTGVLFGTLVIGFSTVLQAKETGKSSPIISDEELLTAAELAYTQLEVVLQEMEILESRAQDIVRQAPAALQKVSVSSDVELNSLDDAVRWDHAEIDEGDCAGNGGNWGNRGGHGGDHTEGECPEGGG